MKRDSSISFEGSCWKDITIKFWKGIEVAVDLQDSNSLLCTEAIIIATDTQYHVKDFLIG